MPLVEVRVPTYRRPELLLRALESLRAQEGTDWAAVVMDDSPDQEGAAVVAGLADARISYRPNLRNLGSSGNLNQAFATPALLGGTYAFVLEDDNWLLPGFIRENLNLMEEQPAKLLLRNQQIWTQTASESTPTGRTTRGEWMREQTYAPLDLRAHLFFYEGISNGGLFWRTEMNTDLQVSSRIADAGLQEYCRTLQVRENLRFASKPLCCWSEMPDILSMRNPAKKRIFGRATQALRRRLIHWHGRSIIEVAAAIAARQGRMKEFELALIDCLHFSHRFQHVSAKERMIRSGKALAKMWLVANPLREHLASASLDNLSRSIQGTR